MFPGNFWNGLGVPKCCPSASYGSSKKLELCGSVLMILARGSPSTIFWNQEAHTGLDKPNDVLTHQALCCAPGQHNKVVLLFPGNQTREQKALSLHIHIQSTSK